MGRAEFPLEVVLRHLRREEERWQLALATLQRRLGEERHRLDHLREGRRAALAQLADEQRSPRLDLEAIGRSLVYVNSLGVAIAAQEQVVRDLARHCDETRDRLLQASRAVKVLDKLKERWLAERRREQLRQEEKVAAEAATGQFNRRMRAS